MRKADRDDLVLLVEFNPLQVHGNLDRVPVAGARRPREPMRGPLLMVLVLAALAMAGCGARGAPDKDEQGRHFIHMTADSTFSPGKVCIPVNSTVVWMNDATIPHDVQGQGDYGSCCAVQTTPWLPSAA